MTSLEKEDYKKGLLVNIETDNQLERLPITEISFQSGNKTLLIDIELEKEFKSATFYIDKIDNPDIIRSASDPTIVYSSFPIEIDSTNFYSTPMDPWIYNITEPARLVFEIACFFTFIVASFSNIKNAVVFVKLLQYLDFLTIIDVEVPLNV